MFVHIAFTLGCLFTLSAAIDVTTEAGSKCSVFKDPGLMLKSVDNQSQILASSYATDEEACLMQCCDHSPDGCNVATFSDNGRALMCQSLNCQPLETCQWMQAEDDQDRYFRGIVLLNFAAPANATATPSGLLNDTGVNVTSTDGTTDETNTTISLEGNTPTGFTDGATVNDTIQTDPSTISTVTTGGYNTTDGGFDEAQDTIPAPDESSGSGSGAQPDNTSPMSWDTFWSDILGDLEGVQPVNTTNTEWDTDDDGKDWSDEKTWDTENSGGRGTWNTDNAADTWDTDNNVDANGGFGNFEQVDPLGEAYKSENSEQQGQPMGGAYPSSSQFSPISSSSSSTSESAIDQPKADPNNINRPESQDNNDQEMVDFDNWNNDLLQPDTEDDDNINDIDESEPVESAADAGSPNTHSGFPAMYGASSHAIAIGVVAAVLLLFMIMLFAIRQLRGMRGRGKRGQYRALPEDMQYEDGREPLYH